MADDSGLATVALDQIQADLSDNIVAKNGATLVGITGTLMGLSFSVVMMRCWARQFILRTFGWDDAAMLLALAFAIAGFAFFAALCRAGGGRRADELSAREQSAFKLSSVLIGLCCVTGICLVKISVGFFLRRFLLVTALRRVVDGFIVFMLVFLVYSVLTFVLICEPTATYWDAGITTGTCWSARTLKIIGNLNAGLNIATDVFTWVLPLHVIVRLQINRRTKLSLVVIMSLGLLSIVASIARVIFGTAWQWSTDLYLWLNIEVTIAILSASLPCLRPIFRSFLGSTAATTTTSYPQNNQTPPHKTSSKPHQQPDDDIPLTSISPHTSQSDAKKENLENLPEHLDNMYGLPCTRRMAGYRMGIYDAQVTVSIASTSVAERETTSGDDSSEDDILPSRRSPVGGITKTTEITVSNA